MTSNNKEDVLAAFAMEDTIEPATLRSYLTRYPEFSDDLLALFNELTLCDLEAEEASSPLETKSAFSKPDRVATVEAALYGEQVRTLSRQLSLPRAFLLGLNAGAVRVSSIPVQLVKRIANEIGVRTQDVLTGMQRGGEQAYAFKADGKPAVHDPVEFWDYVSQADLSDDQKAALDQVTGEHGSR